MRIRRKANHKGTEDTKAEKGEERIEGCGIALPHVPPKESHAEAAEVAEGAEKARQSRKGGGRRIQDRGQRTEDREQQVEDRPPSAALEA